MVRTHLPLPIMEVFGSVLHYAGPTSAPIAAYLGLTGATSAGRYWGQIGVAVDGLFGETLAPAEDENRKGY